jgi:hypothetical protein
MKNSALTIIAGPCSIDENNISEVYELADITVTNQQGQTQRAIAGTRVVGIKSRTELDASGKGMGIDYPIFHKNLELLRSGGCTRELEIPPSVVMAEEIYKKTNMLIASEIMIPQVQMPVYEGKIPKGKLMPWNPAVEQLGWPLMEMGMYAKKNGWHVGIKNGKWVGEDLHHANTEEFKGKTTMEKTWSGLTTYVGDLDGDIILIHRGVDVPNKGDYRNATVHTIAKRVKLATGAKLYFDPSHTYGPKMRQHIVAAVIEAVNMKINEEEYLYDGILIETGTSTTDTDQHITLIELKAMAQELARNRDLVSPENN